MRHQKIIGNNQRLVACLEKEEHFEIEVFR